MTGFHKILCTAVLLAGLASAASGQVALFDAEDYGQVDLVFRESTGNAGAFIAAQDGGAFEPIRELPENDPIRQLASSVGRVDILKRNPNGTRGLVTCTGAILPGGWVLTNHHCIPEKDASHRLLAASILTGYLVQGDKTAKRYDLSVEPEDWQAFLDFSLVRMKTLPEDIPPLKVDAVGVEPGDPLMVIHHPLGRPQVMTRFRCFALREQEGGPILRHRCDTMPGSSGSILFDREMHPVALHHSGGMTPDDDKSFNKSTRLSAILQDSELLREVTGAAPGGALTPPPAGTPAALPLERNQPPAGGLNPGGINDLLRGN